MEKAIGMLDHEQVTVRVRWLPFYLDPSLPKASKDKLEHYKRKFGEERVLQMLPAMKRTGQEEGISFSYDGKIGNTGDSHRLLELAAAKDPSLQLQDKLIEELFSVYFEQEGDIADHAVLAQAAAKPGVGLFPTAANAVAFLKSDAMSDEVRRGVQQAYQQGVTGVPHFTIANKYVFSGAQDPAYFLQAFKKLGLPLARKLR
jgi:predicted DsbA family dithiol-disulfide isomerase